MRRKTHRSGERKLGTLGGLGAQVHCCSPAVGRNDTRVKRARHDWHPWSTDGVERAVHFDSNEPCNPTDLINARTHFTRRLGRGGSARSVSFSWDIMLLPAFFLVNTLSHFNLSNTLGHGMVLQRAPQQAVVWGFGDPGVKISTSFGSKELGATIDDTGLWRIALPPTPAATKGATLTFRGSEGTTLTLDDVLFGDVFLCGGQSNMQYTPRSMAGMNNMSAEVRSSLWR